MEYTLEETKVLESRMSSDGQMIRRRRVAPDGVRFTTYERIEKPRIIVTKSHGGKEDFSREKLKSSIIRSIGKFISDFQVEEIINRVENELIRRSKKVSSREIGELVLEILLKTNKVAYIRFASVFNGFETVEDFEEILAKIKE
ncbi:MAG: ATP cone domain-containing protein [bacterium]|nr:ATP cone domain-containing protein [bacterium]